MPNDNRQLGQMAWTLDEEYDSFDDPRFAADLGRVRELLGLIESMGPGIASGLEGAESLDPTADSALLDLAEAFLVASDEVDVLFNNLRAYANCVASVDGSDVRAKENRGMLSSLNARIDKATSGHDLLLARASEAFVETILSRPAAAAHRFRVSLLRKHRNRLLSLPVEAALASVAADGLHAWGRLYDSITGSTRCRLATKDGEREIGLSESASLLRGPDRGLREAAFRAGGAAFRQHEESLAAILNSIAGWRLAEYELRSHTETYHFLDAALASNRLGRASLDAMMEAVRAARDLGRRSLRLQARLLGVPKLAPWDLLAPCPTAAGEGPAYSFAEGLELVRAAYASVHPAMGDFVTMMRDRRWIESRLLPGKRPGAYCTRFVKSRSPRVFQSYGGSLADVSTLAHELGHAYHGSILAGLPVPESRYPMNLAETASTFAETALGDWLAGGDGASGQGLGAERLLEVAWGDAQDASTFLLNIPVRFGFEKAFYEARSEKPLGPAALSALMEASFREWYGDSLSECDSAFWQSKLHFYMSELSFYNFPYTFGWLFSLGVYARRASLGADFHDFYRGLLLDTGRMETEELARKHLGVDLSKPDFWLSSIGIVKAKVDRFEALVSAAGK
jgi:oligoendopeptidase F